MQIGPRILVIEDDPTVVTLLNEFLGDSTSSSEPCSRCWLRGLPSRSSKPFSEREVQDRGSSIQPTGGRSGGAGVAVGARDVDEPALDEEIGPPAAGKLVPVFAPVVGGDETEKHKPDPEPLLLAAKRMNAEPAKTAYVGDSPFDIRAAKAAGMHAIAVTWGRIHDRDRLEREEPDAIVDTAEELLEHL